MEVLVLGAGDSRAGHSRAGHSRAAIPFFQRWDAVEQFLLPSNGSDNQSPAGRARLHPALPGWGVQELPRGLQEVTPSPKHGTVSSR